MSKYILASTDMKGTGSGYGNGEGDGNGEGEIILEK